MVEEPGKSVRKARPLKRSKFVVLLREDGDVGAISERSEKGREPAMSSYKDGENLPDLENPN